jgi:hypothetical protein
MPEDLSQAPGKAKHFFPGFTIRFHQTHQFVTPAGAFESLSHGDYQGQFHWHDGQGMMTIDASSPHLTADGSSHPHFSAEFAYYSLPVILSPVLQDWATSRSTTLSNTTAPSPQQAPRHELASAEFLRIPEMRPSASETHGAYDPPHLPTHSNPVPSMHFLAAGSERPQPPSRLQSLGPTPFSTPPMPRKTLQFAVSPQSETQRTNSAAFGHSPSPSPSWERTPQSQQSWQPPTAPTTEKQGARERDTVTSAAPTTIYVPQPPTSCHQVAAPHM